MHDLNDMMVFLTVVESGSFTEAANRLNMPKANVSRKVSKLEQHLGITLLERSTRSQRLTHAGKKYLTHCKRIHEEIDLANCAISTELKEIKGRIKVGASITIGQQIMSPCLSDFLHEFPAIEFELSLLNRRVDLIEEGFDLLIRVGKLEDSRLIAKHLGQTARKFYASKDYINSTGTPNSLNALTKHQLLIMNPNSINQPINLHRKSQTQTLKLKPRLLSDDFSVIKDAAIHHQGIALLPDYLVKTEIASGKLVEILNEWSMQPIDIYALYPKHRVEIPKIKKLLDHLIKVFDRHLI